MNIPKHIAIIPDGNRRWAKEKGLPKLEGHRRGFEQLKKLWKTLREQGVKTLTIWAFSTENWNRDRGEVEYLMKMYTRWMEDNLKEAIKNEVRIVHLGRRDRLPKTLLKKLDEAAEKTENFDKYYLAIALDYGGHDEIVRAVNRAKEKLNGRKLTTEEFNKFLDTYLLPDPNPDLVIRTSGEERLSGLLPWQSAYSELMFVKKYLPDFTPADLRACIAEFSRRHRRFGR
jgi:undecaprenyl diphosphate synthase